MGMVILFETIISIIPSNKLIYIYVCIAFAEIDWSIPLD